MDSQAHTTPSSGAARRRHDEVLAEIARFAGSSLELGDVLERIVERAAALTGADRASILLLDRTGRTLLPSALYGMDLAFTAGWKTRPIAVADEPLSREAIAAGAPVVIADAAADARTDKASVAFFGDRSILVAPLVRRGEVIGTLFLNHVRQRYEFTAEDVDTTLAIANQAAIAIDNAQLYGDSRRLAEQLRRSFRYAGEALAAGVDLQQTLQSMLQLAIETVDAEGGALRLLDETGRGAYLVAEVGDEPPQNMCEAVEFAMRSSGTPLGTLRLWRSQVPFDDEERELLGAFAGHARAAVEQARLYAGLQEEQERARQAERTQSDFVSMVSHELRTPLALIKGYVATLLRPSLGLSPAMQTRFLEGIDSAADRLKRLIDNLLSATAVEANAFVFEPQPLDVAELLRNAIAEVGLLAKGRPVDLAFDGTGLYVLADADQLVQVVENLINNAMKYAPGDRPVVVRAARRGSHVRISVLDSGPGIPPEALDLIFQKFYRVSVARAALPNSPSAAPAGTAGGRGTTGAGMGLGLYICRRIITAHGGNIWAENVPSGGAAFHIEVPAVLSGAPTPASGPTT